PTSERVFVSTSPQGLRQDLPPMRLWHKAKKLGVWNPQDIDFSQDVADWHALDDRQRETLVWQGSVFLAGEESVTLDLLPLLMTVAREGRIEEEMYLTSFLFEEAKHLEGFRRFFDVVADDHSDLSTFHGPSYRRIFYEELPAAMQRLLTDPSPVAQVRASVTYNLIVEGVLAETGYYGYGRTLTENHLMPGMQQLVGLIKRDESRHIAFAVYFLSRLIAEHGDVAWEALQTRMSELLPLTMGVVTEGFARVPEGDPMPFNVPQDDVVAYAMIQFQKRLDRIERARGKTLDEINRIANSMDESET
ncbi:MAG: R2-like ligand-binding oxidase, partial [Ktedonobacterales bacterium]